MPSEEKARGRVELLDELRGLSILLMVIYHGAYDLVYLFHWPLPVLHHPLLFFLQPFFAGIFVLLSGMACRFSRNNLRRGVQALAFGALLALITSNLIPGQAVRFGILHLLGLGMLLYYLLSGPLLDRLSLGASLFCCFALYLAHPCAGAGLFLQPRVCDRAAQAGFLFVRLFPPFTLAASVFCRYKPGAPGSAAARAGMGI